MNRRLSMLMADGAAVYPRRSFGAYTPEDLLVPGTMAWSPQTPTMGAAPRRVSAGTRDANRAQFARWVKKEFPGLYRRAERLIPKASAGLSDLGQEQSSWEKFLDTIGNLAQTTLQYKTQKEILDMQLDRAREGLPPLETSQIAPVVKVTTDPATIQYAAGYAGDALKKWVLPGALVLGAFLLFRKRRR